MKTQTASDQSHLQGQMLEMAKAIHDEVRSSLNSRLRDFETEMKMLVGKQVESELVKRHERFEKEMNARLDVLEKSYVAGVSRMETLLKTLPVPQVHFSVPENAIEIKQLPSQVILPDSSLQVNAVISDKAFNIQLKQPKRIKKIEKEILYGPATGRAEKILETTTSEDAEE